MRLSIDTGGTFTDVILESDRGVSIHKASTTPHDPAVGILTGIGSAAASLGLSTADLLAETTVIVHGTTRATNAVITGTTAKTAFLTTSGHPDILVFRYGGRSRLFEYAREYPGPYVPRSLTFEVDERIDWRGKVVRPLDLEGVDDIADQLLELEVEAVGICLLWSIANNAHELAVRERLGQRLGRGVAITLSHEVNPVMREYFRASSTCIDASLKPLMTDYLHKLGARLNASGFGGKLLIASVSGGLVDPARLAEKPVLSINSGPAMAPVAGAHYASAVAGGDTAIVVDTGGTSFDVSVVRHGRIPRTKESWLGDKYVSDITGFPSIDVRTTGAGGGSIARVDPHGLLTVGPDSAGSVPGPVCYGRGGTEVTVTDAAVVLGYLDPRRLQDIGIDAGLDAARRAVLEQVANPLGLDTEQAAAAVLQILTENMVQAVEQVTVEQGIDPRSSILVSGGGAAGFNIVSIARSLGCPKLVIPRTAAALSAAGGLLSQIVAEMSEARFTDTDNFEFGAVNSLLQRLRHACVAEIGEDSANEIEYLAEARYAGQTWEIEVPLSAGHFSNDDDVEALRESFHQLHERVFAVRDQDARLELIGWRVRIQRPLSGGQPNWGVLTGADAMSTREIYLPDSGRHTVPVVAGHLVREPLAGPAIIEMPSTTVVLPIGAVAELNSAGSLVIDIRQPSMAALAAPALR